MLSPRRLCTCGRIHMYQTRLGVWYHGDENGKNSHNAGAALHALHPPYAVENLGSGSGLSGKCFACLDAHKGCQLVHSSCWVLRVCKGIAFYIWCMQKLSCDSNALTFKTYSGLLTSPDESLLIHLPHALCHPTLGLELGTCTARQGKLRV